MVETSIHVYLAELDGTGRSARAVFAGKKHAKLWLESLTKEDGSNPQWERVHTDRWQCVVDRDTLSIERQRVRDCHAMIVAEEMPHDAWRK